MGLRELDVRAAFSGTRPDTLFWNEGGTRSKKRIPAECLNNTCTCSIQIEKKNKTGAWV
jgi:hypothetical protein